MQINITYNSSVASAPAGFKTAVQAAVSYFESKFCTNITVNISIGWGEAGGKTVAPGTTANAITPNTVMLDYNRLRNALWADANSSAALTAAKSLPSQDPTNGGTFVLTRGQAKALGFIAPDASGIDGSIGLDSSTAFNFDTTNRAKPGLVDAVGVIENEISKVLGRVSYLGQTGSDGTKLYGTVDLFRYANGLRAPATRNTYFSLDGNAMLTPFNSGSGSAADWASSVNGDAFGAFGDVGITDGVTSTDLSLMDVLGYHRAQAIPAKPTATVAATNPITTTTDITIAAGKKVFFKATSTNYATWCYTLSGDFVSNPPSLTNAGTIYAIDDRGISFAMTDYKYLNNGRTSVLRNETSGVIIVYAGGPDGTAALTNFDSQSPDVYNAGLIEVVSKQRNAIGVSSNDPFSSFTNTGTLIVWSKNESNGVTFGYGGNFSNSGTIDVTGGTALYPLAVFSPIAVAMGGFSADICTFNNSGTIRATSTGDLPSAAVLYGNCRNYVNSGTIVGDYAFTTDSFSLKSPVGDVTLTNSGTIIGDIVPAPSFIHNTGTIAGDITFADGDSVYDGAAGHLDGTIYLGHGNNSVALGSEGGIVYGGGGSDTIIGGAGDDFFDITRGMNTIDGKGGTNTLSLASSDRGYNVNLGTGRAAGAGVTTLANIQQVIGSTFNDKLSAGTSAATLISGGGVDTLIGGPGNDTLVAGGGGGDTMTGGRGNDRFIYSSGDAQLVITDFRTNGDNDILNIDGYSAASSVKQQGADTLITLSSSDSVLLKNVQATSLTASNVVYRAAQYTGPTLPPSQPIYGRDPIEFSYDLTIYAGEPINIPVGEWNYIVEPSGYTVIAGLYRNDYGNHATLDNFGAINVSGNDKFGLNGIVWDNQSSTGGFTNEAGAKLTVSNTGGAAQGVGIAAWSAAIINAGTISVKAVSGIIGGEATGIGAGSNTKVINKHGGVLAVTNPAGDSAGVYCGNGGSIGNDGLITVSASGADHSAWGIYIGSSDLGPTVNGLVTPSSVINTGTMNVAGLNGAKSYGIRLADRPTNNTPTVVNSGTITANVAISVGRWITAAITNSGILNGNIDLGGRICSLTNTGTINGNILCDNDLHNQYVAGPPPRQTVDLRQGVFHGSITIAPTLDSSLSEYDVIELGANGTKVTVNDANGKVRVNVVGGAGADVITAGKGNDTIAGGGGADKLNGGAGKDTFVYKTVSDSKSTTYDTITGFDALSDKIDMWFKVTGINTAVTTGALNSGTNFDANLAAAIGSSKLAAHHAVEFTPSSGSLAGQHFLIVDCNGTAGYQAGADLVINLVNPAHMTSLGIGTFT